MIAKNLELIINIIAKFSLHFSLQFKKLTEQLERKVCLESSLLSAIVLKSICKEHISDSLTINHILFSNLFSEFKQNRT